MGAIWQLVALLLSAVSLDIDLHASAWVFERFAILVENAEYVGEEVKTQPKKRLHDTKQKQPDENPGITLRT